MSGIIGIPQHIAIVQKAVELAKDAAIKSVIRQIQEDWEVVPLNVAIDINVDEIVSRALAFDPDKE